VHTLLTPRRAAALDFLDVALPDADDVEELLVLLAVDEFNPELEPVPDEDVTVGAGGARVNVSRVG